MGWIFSVIGFLLAGVAVQGEQSLNIYHTTEHSGFVERGGHTVIDCIVSGYTLKFGDSVQWLHRGPDEEEMLAVKWFSVNETESAAPSNLRAEYLEKHVTSASGMKQDVYKLIINNAQINNSGHYECALTVKATKVIGESFSLTVTAPPENITINGVMDGGVLSEQRGVDKVIICEAVLQSEGTMELLLDGQSLKLTASRASSDDSPSSVETRHVYRESDEGKRVTCRIRVPRQQTVESTVTLYLQYHPQVSCPKVVNALTQLTIVCEVKANPLPVHSGYTWKKKNELISNRTQGLSVSVQPTDDDTRALVSLKFEKYLSHHLSDYTFTAKNEFGSRTAQVSFQQNEASTAPSKGQVGGGASTLSHPITCLVTSSILILTILRWH